MLSEKQEKYIYVAIPVNYETGLQIKNFDFKPAFLFQAVLISSVIGGVIFLIEMSFFSKLMELTTAISTAIGFALISGFMLYQGFNRESPFGYFYNIIQFYKNKRVALNNPRVKKEWSPYTDSADETAVLPRDRLIALYNEAKEIYDKKMQEKAKSDGSNENKTEFVFADDIQLDEKLAKKEERKQGNQTRNKSAFDKMLFKFKKKGGEDERS